MRDFGDLIDERGLPSSVEAERTILGAILLDNACLDETELTCSDFVLDSHQRIFARMAGLREEGHAVDIITLSEELRNRKEIESIGGVAYLASLTEGLPRRLAIEEYVGIVRDKAKLRRIIIECSLTSQKAIEQDIDPDALLADHDLRTLEITSGDHEVSSSLAEVFTRQYPILLGEKEGRAPQNCVSTGLDILDRKLGGGWLKTELAIIAARTSKGKSSLWIQTLIACGRRNVGGYFVQLEMGEMQILRRILAAMTDIPFARLKHPKELTPVDMTRIEDAREELKRFPVRIEIPRSLTAAQFVARARNAKRRYGIQIAALDYLQKLRFAGAKFEVRHLAVSDAAQQLANLAKHEDLAVIAISSLTDKSGRAANAVPSMGDLRQSGDIAYEAGSVLLLHPEEQINSNRIRWTGQLILEKQRQGETGPFPVVYRDTLQFEDPNAKPKSPQPSMFESAGKAIQ